MGLFSWFGKAPPAPVERVWANDVARWSGVLRAVREAEGAVLIVVFFEASAAVARTLLTAARVRFAEVADVPRAWEPGAQVTLVRADRVRNLAGYLPAPLVVIGAELHPLPSEGRALLDTLARLTPAVPTFHASLEDPLLARFGGGRIAEMMERLGLGPEEPIEDTLVTASLAKAREKMAKSVRNPRESASMEAWFETNVGRQEG